MVLPQMRPQLLSETDLSHKNDKRYLVPLPWRWPQVRCRLRGRTAAARCRPGCRASCGCNASSPAHSLTLPARTPLYRVWWVRAGSRWCRWERTWRTGRRASPDCSQFLKRQENTDRCVITSVQLISDDILGTVEPVKKRFKKKLIVEDNIYDNDTLASAFSFSPFLNNWDITHWLTFESFTRTICFFFIFW